MGCTGAVSSRYHRNFQRPWDKQNVRSEEWLTGWEEWTYDVLEKAIRRLRLSVKRSAGAAKCEDAQPDVGQPLSKTGSERGWHGRFVKGGNERIRSAWAALPGRII